jgi:hypothetical protein
MKYTRAANVINIVFLLGIFVIPLMYCAYDSTMAAELGGNVIFGSLLLSTVALTDWYYLYQSNSYRGVAWAAAIGLVLSGGIIMTAAILLPASFLDLATLKNTAYWGHFKPLLRFYVAGIGMVVLAPYSLLRLWLIRLLAGHNLPQPK